MSRGSHWQLLQVLCAAAALLVTRDAAGQATSHPADSRLAWPEITAQNRPWTRWWWMGSAVDAPNLDRELARYHAAGLGGVEVTPIYGVDGWENRGVPYLSPAWMNLLNHAIATGKSLGMETDMSAGTGWCFGGPTVTAADANALLVATTQDVPAGGKLMGAYDPAATQALVAFSSNGKCVELTDRITRDGHVDWTAGESAWRVYAISQKPSGVMVKRAAPGGAGPMLNLFYPAAVTRYLQWFEQPFAETKPQLRALFQDSYEYNSNWAPDFLAEFARLRGYRLETELPALLGSAQDDRTARVKSDYRETLSDIMVRESIPIWARWAHDRGYLIRYQAHGAPGNLLDLYGDADIPETEMFHLDRNILVSKFASSAAHLTGKQLASAETGTWLAEHFTETLGEMKGLVDYLFLAGINHVVYHGTAYSPDEVPWPGWCFYASTEMNPRNALWHDVPALNAYIERCQSMLQAGRADNDVLVYWPIFDSWNNANGMAEGFSISGKGWLEGEPVGSTAQRLWDRGYAFDYVSDRQLASMKLDACGSMTAGSSRYRAVVVPLCRHMPVETLRRLVAFAADGVTVIFEGGLPGDVPGWGGLNERRAEFQALLDQARTQAHVLAGDAVTLLQARHVSRETMTDRPGLHFVRRAFAGGRVYFICNQGSEALDDWVTLSQAAVSVEVMDPMTGRTGLARIRSEARGATQVDLQIDPGASLVLRVFDAIKPASSAWGYHHADGAPVPLTGTWHVKFLEGGPTLPDRFQTDHLDTWTKLGDAAAQTFAGTSLYTITFDAPGGRLGPWSLDLGRVCESARVRLNGQTQGTVFTAPFRVAFPDLRPRANVLEVEVTNTSANRIRDLDVRHVPWKIFHSPNVMSVVSGSFDASHWPLAASGLIGPVALDPEKAEK